MVHEAHPKIRVVKEEKVVSPRGTVKESVAEDLNGRPSIRIIGGAFDRSGTVVAEGAPADLTSPIGELRNMVHRHAENLLRSVREDTGDASLETSAEESRWVEEYIVPRIKESVRYWTDDPALADEVTAERLLKTVVSIETGERSTQEFSYRLLSMLDRKGVRDPERALTASKLARRKRIQELWRKIETTHLSEDPAEGEHVLAVRRDALWDEMCRTFVQVATEMGAEVNVPPHHIFMPSHIKGARIQHIGDLRALVQQESTGLSATTREFLMKLKAKDPATGKERSAWDVIANTTGGIPRTPSDRVQKALDARRKRFMGRMPTEHMYVLDRPFTERNTDGSLQQKSLAFPISRILFALEEEAAANKEQHKGDNAEKPAHIATEEFDITRNIEEIRNLIVGNLNNARLLARASDRVQNSVVESEAQSIGKQLTETLVTEAHQSALRRLSQLEKEEGANLRRAAKEGYGAVFGDIPPFPDRFSMLQFAFTTELFERLGIADSLAKVSDGKLTTPIVSSAWRDTTVSRMIESLEQGGADIGRKRAAVETLISDIPAILRHLQRVKEHPNEAYKPTADERRRFAEENDLSVDVLSALAKEAWVQTLSPDDTENIMSAGLSFYKIAIEKRSDRLSIERASSKDTSALLNLYDEKFGVLVRAGTLPPLRAKREYPERGPNETVKAYDHRCREFAKEMERKEREEDRINKVSRAKAVLSQLKKFLSKQESGTLTGIFIGTLGPIVGSRRKVERKDGAKKTESIKEQVLKGMKEPGLLELLEPASRGKKRYKKLLPGEAVSDGGALVRLKNKEVRKSLEKILKEIEEMRTSMGNAERVLRATLLEARAVTGKSGLPYPERELSDARALRTTGLESLRTVREDYRRFESEARGVGKEPENPLATAMYTQVLAQIESLLQTGVSLAKLGKEAERAYVTVQIRMFEIDLEEKLAAETTEPQRSRLQALRDTLVPYAKRAVGRRSEEDISALGLFFAKGDQEAGAFIRERVAEGV